MNIYSHFFRLVTTGTKLLVHAMKAKFGSKGSRQAFQAIANLENIDTSRISAHKTIRWTAQEHAILESLLQRCTSWKETHDELEAEFPKGRSMAMVRQYATSRQIDVSKVAGPLKWTLQEDNVLREFFESGVPRPEYPSRFFGDSRPRAHSWRDYRENSAAGAACKQILV